MESLPEKSSLVSLLCAVAAVISTIQLTTVEFRLQREMQTEAANLNNTKNAEVDLLFFNRVPKVGSQTMMRIIDILSRVSVNNFSAYRDSEEVKAKN